MESSGSSQPERRLEPADLAESGWDLSVFDGHKHCLVITVRRSGRAVATPVWYGIDDDRLYFLTASDAGKVKRLRRDPRLIVAPCTFAGSLRGPKIEGRARFLDATEAERAKRTIAAGYGLPRQVYYRTIGPRDVVYVEVRPPADRSSG